VKLSHSQTGRSGMSRAGFANPPTAALRTGRMKTSLTTRPPFFAGAITGVTAAAGGLAVAEVVAATSRTFQSPVVDVADRVVDGVPRTVKDLAIEWFGTNDKIALLTGIASILVVYAAVLGLLVLSRRWRLSLAGIAVFGLAGAYASQSSRRAAPLWAILPSLAGAAVAAGLLMFLRRRYLPTGASVATAPTDRPAERQPSIAELVPNSRRRFFVTAGATAAAAVALGATGRQLSGRASAASSRKSLTIPRARRPLAPAPSGISVGVEGVSPFFTPNADFYRIDTAITVPQVPVDGWTLSINGLVDKSLSLTFDDLLERELVEADITLTCVSNEVGGTLMGTARWLGVRLDSLLQEAGISPEADQIVGRSVDGWTGGFPTATLDGRDALVAIGMNGELLPVEHGFPARLIIPGLYGYVSATKWLKEIELTRFDAFDAYWVKRGWDALGPIKVQSRIDTPRGLAKVGAGTVAIGGVAWAQTRGIERVELSIDEGDWVEATLADELNNVTWRQWSYAWDAAPGRHSITVRATEKNGPIQTPDRSEPFPNGATGQHQIIVLVR
jgi:DMSO/TMAO reductase YedYZ molybdopterin-dependent catalytic subunit